jgi:hypothetical protein
MISWLVPCCCSAAGHTAGNAAGRTDGNAARNTAGSTAGSTATADSRVVDDTPCEQVELKHTLDWDVDSKG